MAKNKNRERKPHQRSSAERDAQQSRSAAAEGQTEEMKSEVGPSSVAHKGKKKSFGHN